MVQAAPLTPLSLWSDFPPPDPAIAFACPCGVPFRAHPEWAGKVVVCRGCARRLVAPADGSAPVAEAPGEQPPVRRSPVDWAERLGIQPEAVSTDRRKASTVAKPPSVSWSSRKSVFWRGIVSSQFILSGLQVAHHELSLLFILRWV